MLRLDEVSFSPCTQSADRNAFSKGTSDLPVESVENISCVVPLGTVTASSQPCANVLGNVHPSSLTEFNKYLAFYNVKIPDTSKNSFDDWNWSDVCAFLSENDFSPQNSPLAAAEGMASVNLHYQQQSLPESPSTTAVPSSSAADSGRQTPVQSLREQLIIPDAEFPEPIYLIGNSTLAIPPELEYKGMILPLRGHRNDVINSIAFVAKELWQKQKELTDYERVEIVKIYVDKRKEYDIVGRPHSNECRLIVQHCVNNGWVAAEIAYKTGFSNSAISAMLYPRIEPFE
ncbi:hypothetical protein SK355_12145 (plasmid) [Candidatus Fukatsuia symbiotica]|uniref:Uncharacterized protein n=1 Tax=Candidatus Fukatsuia symbiotica TaxID=1878942 RepID=A0A2U8IB22_9GAMM|nr:hypothetical protein [Candidatus Fukatsuia symbiotica]AWK15534.1 hypothetical protein CCS41_13995 [Candidatus Fukatsuia symbiotica]MEA9445925.1 hypothetical protein [Candidatus Fukatsuia symbiotica]